MTEEEYNREMNRSLTYKERLLIGQWPADMIAEWTEEECEAEYDAAFWEQREEV